MVHDSEHNDRTQSFTPLSRGTIIGHYRIIEKIGAGGMGEVYLAEDTELKREIALKFLPPHLCADEDCRARFKREAQSAAALKHPNIITIYEVSEHNGRPFFAMELVNGESLREIIKGKTLSINSIIDLAIQMCEGLGKAHDADIIHRDIKPTNIIIDDDGRPKILDFGLAAVQGQDKLTKTGSTLGTIGYMSPEQVKGEDIDHRSDLFSIGVLLYEMITGRRPFEGEGEAAILNSILNTNPEPLARYKKDIPDELQRIVSKLLEKNVELRYQTTGGIVSDLNRLKREKESAAVPSQVTGSKKSYSKIIIPVIGIMIALAVLIFKPWKFEISPRHEAIARENKLAIMYFDNLADPTDSLKLGEITTNLLITDLSESEYVKVVSSQRLYDILKQLGREGIKKVDQDIATQVAKKANARWMLLGSILKSEPNIILTSQIVDVESGDAVASQRIEGITEEDIFKLVDKLTVGIKEDLSLPVDAAEEHDVTVASVTTRSQEAYRYYLEGKDLFYKHYWTEASLLFKNALENDSTFAMAHYYLASMADWSSDDSVAAFYIDKAMQASDNVTRREKLYIKSLDARTNGDFEKAIDELQKLVKAFPDEKDAYIIIGLIKKFEMNEIGDAITFFNKAIELDPYNKEAYNQLAYAYNAIGQFQDAIWAINKYIEIAPDEANPYDSRGEIYAYNGLLDEAVNSYEKALEIKPDFITSFRNLGRIYVLKKMYMEAESYFRKFLSSADQHIRANGRYNLSLIPLHQGKFRQALRQLNMGIETDSLELGISMEMFSKILRRISIYSYCLRDYDSTIIEIKRAMTVLNEIESNPVLWKIPLDGYADIAYLRSGKEDKATNLIDNQYYKIDMMTADELNQYYFWSALVKIAREDYDSAINLLERNYAPAQNSAYIFFLARCYLKVGRIADAVVKLERFMRQYDNTNLLWPEFYVCGHYWLGQTYEESGWNDKAIEQYETFLDTWKKADPGIVEINDAKERLAKLKSKI